MSIAAPIGYSIVTRRPYRAEALTALFPRIFLDSDIEALAEVLQHRRCFRFAGHKHLRLSEYLLLVCRERSGRPGSGPGLFWDRAYDLALDKFSSLPRDLHTESGTDALKNEMFAAGPHGLQEILRRRLAVYREKETPLWSAGAAGRGTFGRPCVPAGCQLAYHAGPP